MKITDIDLTNTIAVAQLTGVLIIIAFLLLFIASTRAGKAKSSKN